jgi:hypothetical protein
MLRTNAWGSPNFLAIAHELLKGSHSTTAIMASLVVGVHTPHGQPVLKHVGGLRHPVSQRHCSNHPGYHRHPKLGEHRNIHHMYIPWLFNHNSALLYSACLLHDKLCVWLCTSSINSTTIRSYMLPHLMVTYTSKTKYQMTFFVQHLLHTFVQGITLLRVCSQIFFTLYVITNA